MNSTLGMSAELATRKIDGPHPEKVRAFRIPLLGRMVLLTKDQGEAIRPGEFTFATDLHAVHRDGDGKVRDVYHLESGMVTNVGVMAMANDFNWAQNAQTLKLQNWHATGTGVTAAAMTDIALGTLAAPTTANAQVGVQSFISAANVQKYQTVATIAYGSTLAITEWGLHSAQVLSATTGTPLTAATATLATVTATPYTASSATVQGEEQLIIVPATTLVYGLITSNTTAALSIPAWYKVADGTAGATPGATEAFVIKPVLWDRRQFAAINVVSGDSIQFTYTLTINAGG